MKRTIRQIRVESKIVFVPLTKGYESVIDAADVTLVAGFNWTAKVRRRADGAVLCVYAYRRICVGRKSQTVFMHRAIAGTPDGLQTDHIDGNGLNNSRSNLRIATSTENSCNRQKTSNNKSGFKGVYFDKAKEKWLAQIMLLGKTRRLGGYANIEDAAAAYAKASAELHGEFGRIA